MCRSRARHGHRLTEGLSCLLLVVMVVVPDLLPKAEAYDCSSDVDCQYPGCNDLCDWSNACNDVCCSVWDAICYEGRCKYGYKKKGRLEGSCNDPPACWKSGKLCCPAGTFNMGNTSTCMLCPAGKYSNAIGAVSNETCRYCDKGKFAAVNSPVCTSCPVGKYGYQGFCLNCDAGKYSTQPGQ